VIARTTLGVVAVIDRSPASRYPPDGVVDSVAARSSGGTVQRRLAVALGGMARRSAATRGPAVFPVNRWHGPAQLGRGLFLAAARRRATYLTLPLLFTLPLGCAVRPTTFEIVDYHDAGDAKRYQETFDEAYYDLDEHGNVNIVLRRTNTGQGGEQDVTQIIRIRSVWRPVPGRTASHRTQINAAVSYFVTGGRIGDTFEGAGAVFFRQNRGKTILAGTLDHSVLRPKRQLAPGEPLFARAELSGTFRATRDRRQVVRIINEADRLFGPLPPHDAPK